MKTFSFRIKIVSFFILNLCSLLAPAQFYTLKDSVAVEAPSHFRTYKFEPQQENIFFFNNENEVLEFVTSPETETVVRLKGKNAGTWLSKNADLGTIIKASLIKENKNKRVYLNQSILKPARLSSVNVLFGVGALLLIALARVFFQDAFYAFLVPFKAYSNTVEKMAQTNRLSIFVSVLFFIYVLVALTFLLFPEIPFMAFSWNFGLLLTYFIIKWLALNRSNAIFGDAGFSRLHLLEFLRYGIFLFVIIYAVVLVIFLNDVGVNFVYEIILFPYLLVWFARLWIIYYKRYNHNLLYFFSYLCATEVIPLLVVVFFWRSKILV